MFAISILMDIIWMVIVMPAWSEDESANPEWKDMSTTHSFTNFMAFIEVIIKGIMLFFLHKKGALDDFKYINNYQNIYTK